MRGLFLLLYVFPTYLCLRIVSFEVPESVSPRDDIWLSCEYDLEGEKLESVKWYKDDWEIYRFFPDDTEELRLGQKYNIPYDSGVFLDPRYSNNTHIYLWKSNLDTEGSYRCVVSSSGFQTIYEEKMLKMNVIPSEVPRIYGSSKEYKMGDLINLSCTFGPSKQLSRLVWYIYRDWTPASTVYPLNTPLGTASPPLTESRLSFVLGPRVQSVTCVAVVPQEPTFSTIDVQYRAGGGISRILLPGTSRQIPIITRVPERYSEGDNVNLVCFAGIIPHLYKLEWSINDEPAPPEFLSGDEGSSLVLRFHPTADHWKGEKMSLKCKGTFTGETIEASVHFPFGKEQKKLKFRCRPPHSHQLCNGCCFLSTLPDPQNI